MLGTLVADRRTPYLPPERLAEARDRRVREIVRYAAETVPHYRELFAAEGIDPREIRTAADLALLPLLDKETVQRDPDRLVSESAEGRSSVSFWTSGSTGLRLRVQHDRRSLLRNIAYRQRFRPIEARFIGRRLRYVIVSINSPGNTSRTIQAHHRQTVLVPGPTRHRIDSSESMAGIVAAVDRLRPHAMRANGTHLEQLYRYLAATRTRMHRPKLLIYGSDTMSPEGRRLIEEDFGIPLLARYNAVEVFQLSFMCEERRHYHVHADLTHVRVVDRSGRELPPGELGEVVVSNLVNRGTVLLNYRLGDLARLVPESCPCGRTLPLLGDLEGRLWDVIHRPDGTSMHPRLVNDVVKTRPWVIRHQLVQVEPERFELRLVTEPPEAYESVVGGIVDELQSLLWPSARIDASRRETLEPDASGKFRVVSALRPS